MGKLNLHHIDPTGGGWEKPAPLQDAAPAAPFPLDELPGPMQRMAEAVAASMPCPVDLPACTMLAAASAAVGATRRLKIKTSWYEQARLWIAVVAPTGSKKSPAASCVLSPIRRAEKRLRREHETAMDAYNKELAEWKRRTAEAAAAKQSAPEKPREPVERQIEANDMTRESLPDLIRENPRGLLAYRDELTGWAKSLNQYKSGRGDDKQFWLSLWSGEPISVNRRGRRVRVVDPFVTVCGNLPPAVLSDLADKRTREDGWLHRILFSWPDPTAPCWTDCEPDPLTMDEYTQLFESLFDLDFDRDGDGEPVPRTLGFASDAKERFAAFINELASEISTADFAEELRGPWAKMEGCCARLSLLLHVCRQACGETAREDVDKRSVDKAIQLIRYFQAHARRIYPQMLQDGGDELRQNAEAVLIWVRRKRDAIVPADEGSGKPPMAFTWRIVRRDLARRFEGRDEELRRALQALEARGYLREATRQREGERGRRPLPDFHVNPTVFSALADN